MALTLPHDLFCSSSPCVHLAFLCWLWFQVSVQVLLSASQVATLPIRFANEREVQAWTRTLKPHRMLNRHCRSPLVDLLNAPEASTVLMTASNIMVSGSEWLNCS